MPKFTIINNADQIPSSPQWVDAKTFVSRNRLVSYRGKNVGTLFAGRRYRLIAKKIHKFSFVQCFFRGLLGLVAIASTLGTALAFKNIRKLFARTEKVRFGIFVDNPRAHQKPSAPRVIHRLPNLPGRSIIA